MLKVTTESGAVYLIDLAEGRAKRVGPHSDGIVYTAVPDGEWLAWNFFSPIVIGERLVMTSTSRGKYRHTTQIVGVEVIES